MRYSDLSASHRKKLERHSLLKCPRRRINFVRRVMADCSIDRLSKRVGCTRTHLSLVLNGKRNLTDEMQQKCLDSLEFEKEKVKFLSVLM